MTIAVARINGDYRVLIKPLLSGDENLLLGNYFGGRKVYLATALVAVRRSRYLNPDVVWVERSRRLLSKKSLSLFLPIPLTNLLFLLLSRFIATTVLFQSRRLPPRPLNIPEL